MVTLRVRVRAGEAGEEQRLDLEVEPGGERTLGRGATCDVRLPDPRVSVRHARLVVDGGVVALVDEASLNGSFVGGVRLRPRARRSLVPGDVVTIGPFQLHIDPIGAGDAAAGPGDAEGTAAVARELVRALHGALGSGRGPALVVQSGALSGRRFELGPGETLVIGRGESCRVQLPDPDASREHAAVHQARGGATVADLESKNGTDVGGARLGHAPRPLRDGDELVVGTTRLRYEDPAEGLLRALEDRPDEPAAPPAPAAAARPRRAAPPVERVVIAVGVGVLVVAGAAAAWLLGGAR